MMIKRLIFLIFLLSSEKIFSQVNEDTIRHEHELNEIEIVAFKQNTDLSLQPVSANILSASLFKENNLLNIKEISAYVPNLFIPDYGSKMTSPVYIRGIGAAKNAPSVGMYVDGVPYFDRSTFDFNINDIERVEVLRGPQGTIYGRNTMGGIINVYSKSPFKYKGTDIRLSTGNYDFYQTGISHYGRTDNDHLGYSISGNYLHSGGYFHNTFTDKQADPMDAFSIRARLSWKIYPRLTVHLILACEYSDQDGYPYGIYDKETDEIQNVNYNSHSFYCRNMSSNGLNIEYRNDHFQLGAQTSVQYYDGIQGLDQDFSSEEKYYADFYQQQKMYSQELNIRSIKKKNGYQWQFGLFGFVQDYTQTNDTDYQEAGRHVLQDVENPTKGFAAYHQSAFNNLLVNNLSIILGIRYDFEKTNNSLIRTTIETDKALVSMPAEIARTSFAQIIPKASVQYAFENKSLTYFSVAKGYKTGGFNTTADEEKDRTFAPEHSWCYDWGIKNSLISSLIDFDLSLFYIHWNDQQISQTKPTGQGFLLKNAGKSASKGFEFSTQINPMKNINFQVSYGYTNAKYLQYKESETTNYDGNYLPMVPQNTLAAGINYSIKTNFLLWDEIVLHGQYIGTGKLYWNDRNDILQPYYGIFNGKISIVKNKFLIDLWAKNMGGEEYIAYYFTSMGEHYAQKGKPFTCGVNLSVGF
jgi:outer membrane receptor protein involved in Fe transport